MQLTLRDSLILVLVTVVYQGQQITIPDVVVDTGSAKPAPSSTWKRWRLICHVCAVYRRDFDASLLR